MVVTENPPLSPLRLTGKIVAGILALIVVLGAMGLAFYFAGRSSGVGRIVLAAILSIAVGWLGVGYFRQLASPPPPDSPPTDVYPEFQLAYVCDMCSLELSVVKVSDKERAPRHCGEAMILVQR
ncbi:MAG: hypothetical protein ABIS18_04895 [Actinomycetota bacterium]